MDTPNKITLEDVKAAFSKTEEAGPHRGLLPETKTAMEASRYMLKAAPYVKLDETTGGQKLTYIAEDSSLPKPQYYKIPELTHNAPDHLKEQFKVEEKTDNIYENGKPDLRFDPTQTKPSRFRKRYRKLKPEEVVLHDEIKRAASHLEFLIEKTNPSRERSLGITKLEESIMWTIKGLTG